MWNKLSILILRKRLAFIVVLSLATAIMVLGALKIQLSFEFARILPTTDPAYKTYEAFKDRFGEDGNVLVIGFEDPRMFELKKFQGWYDLSEQIKKIDGVKEVLSLASLYNIERNDSLQRFEFKQILTSRPEDQQTVDSIARIIKSLPFYEGLAYSKDTSTTLMAVTFERKDLNSSHRLQMVKDIKEAAEKFGAANNIQMHYSGMPYIRTEYMNKVSGETKMFLALAVLVTGIILYLFFRSITSVLLSLGVVLIGVVWALGTMGFLDYRITVLSGMIPPLIIIIGVPNCIFLINKYHQEYLIHKNKVKALSRMIQTVGLSLFLANVTTAIGFGVFYFTNSSLLVEFGVVAAINVMVTYAITLILIPIVLSFMPEPQTKQISHLEGKRINKVLGFIDRIVHNHRPAIYITITVISLISVYGMLKINIIGFVVDDLPKRDPIYEDLHFFESRFNGVLPFEILVDTKKRGGVFADDGRVLYRINNLQKEIAKYEEFSKPLSVVEGTKFFYQAYRNGREKFYILPGALELKKLTDYLPKEGRTNNRLSSFVDTSNRFTRVSYQVKDVGSVRMKELINELNPKIDSIFGDEYDVTITGHSPMFLKSNDYLFKNLFESLLIEIVLITIVGMLLFRSIKIIILSKLPCLIPLLITAGLMGFFDIHFKPSTILIFTIAFGISSDGTIYFLTKYRHELKKNKLPVKEAISATIFDTGVSMVYTAVILFCGFAIFAGSSFGGTIALGVLVSITLLVSMCTNLILLPSILLSLDRTISKREMLEEPVFDIDESVEGEEESGRNGK